MSKNDSEPSEMNEALKAKDREVTERQRKSVQEAYLQDKTEQALERKKREAKLKKIQKLDESRAEKDREDRERLFQVEADKRDDKERRTGEKIDSLSKSAARLMISRMENEANNSRVNSSPAPATKKSRNKSSGKGIGG